MTPVLTHTHTHTREATKGAGGEWECVMRPWLSGMTVGQVMPWPLATPRVPALTLAVHRLTACSVCEDYALQKDMTIKYD